GDRLQRHVPELREPDPGPRNRDLGLFQREGPGADVSAERAAAPHLGNRELEHRANAGPEWYVRRRGGGQPGLQQLGRVQGDQPRDLPPQRGGGGPRPFP
ncbi:unnamed protein product, partial [Amoebophrya sp. A120]